MEEHTPPPRPPDANIEDPAPPPESALSPTEPAEAREGSDEIPTHAPEEALESATTQPLIEEDTQKRLTQGPSGGPSVKPTRRLKVPPDVLRSQVEALLFVSASPISVRALAKTLSVEAREVRHAIEMLREDSLDRGIEPAEVSGGYQLRTKPAHGDILRQFLQAKPARLSRAALETLAIVAYRQPIIRAEVEDIRGVDSGAVLRGLLERRLLRILGRKEEPGRPILYGTSAFFLELFGIKSLKELPTLREFVELSEEHQRLVDRQAPLFEDEAEREVEDYLSDLENSPLDLSPSDIDQEEMADAMSEVDEEEEEEED